MKKIKIIQVIYSFEVGGIETLMLELCNNLDKEKYEVHLLTLTNDKLKMIPLLNEDVIVHSLDFNELQLKTLKGLFFGLRELINLFDSIKPLLVQTHFYFIPLFFTSLAIKLSKVKILHLRTVHTAGLFYENQKTFLNKIRLFTEKIALRLNKTYIISISNIVYKNNIKYFKNIVEDIKLIPNGVNFKKYNKENYKNITKSNFNIKEDTLLITYVARIDNGKNHDFLVDLWKEVLKEIPNALLCFAGDGILEEKLRKQVKDNNLENSIIFLGSINNVPELLSVSDIAVFPSSFEGFSLVMLEKLAMNLPVVASYIEPFQEIVSHNENGYLIPLDKKDEWIRTIISLCKDKTLRKEIGEKGYKSALRFSIENCVNLHYEYYDKCLKEENI